MGECELQRRVLIVSDCPDNFNAQPDNASIIRENHGAFCLGEGIIS